MKSAHLIYMLLLLHRSMLTAKCEEKNSFRITDRVFTCSRWLSTAIDNFCNNVYKIVKRETSPFMDKLIPNDLQKSSVEKRWQRVKRQVARECCERPCTVANIIMYCPEDSKVVKENPSIFE